MHMIVFEVLFDNIANNYIEIWFSPIICTLSSLFRLRFVYCFHCVFACFKWCQIVHIAITMYMILCVNELNSFLCSVPWHIWMFLVPRCLCKSHVMDRYVHSVCFLSILSCFGSVIHDKRIVVISFEVEMIPEYFNLKNKFFNVIKSR
jgi:hypothetical protein